MSDPLADWWVHPVTVARFLGGDDGFGGSYADPETLTGFVNDRVRLVRAASGNQAASATQVALPAGTAPIPLGSKVTLPTQFGDTERTVIASSIGDGGGQPTPDHIEIALL